MAANMLKYALTYITGNGDRHPLPVFPLSEGNKTPLIGKKRGGNGCLDATTDPEQVKRWWTTYPNANIGIATGEKSGVIVIDVDIKHHEGKFGDTTFTINVLSKQYQIPPQFEKAPTLKRTEGV